MEEPQLIPGSIHKDSRGTIAFCNDFNFSEIKRFYFISPESPQTIRAWQGHRLEKRSFYVSQGAFKVNLIFPDNWSSPRKNLSAITFDLTASKSQILIIPEGYINGFRALENNSQLLIFATSSIEESMKDDYRWEMDYFENVCW